MRGHVENMHPELSISQTAKTWLFLILVVAVNPASAGAACRTASSLQQSLKLTRLMHQESKDLLTTYKASQGDLSDVFCQKPSDMVPEPVISGLDPAERMLSIYAHCDAYLPHLTKVTEQQTDLQLSSSPLISKLRAAQNRIRGLGGQINCLYQTLFPNLPIPPEPVDRQTSVPPPQNEFQQKIYGCAVLKSFKEFLANSARELKTIRSKLFKRTKF